MQTFDYTIGASGVKCASYIPMVERSATQNGRYMKDLLKIIVTDSAGVEHVFDDSPGDVEHYLELQPLGSDDEPLSGAVRVVTRTWTTRAKCDTETESLFFAPRRVDVLYGDEDS